MSLCWMSHPLLLPASQNHHLPCLVWFFQSWRYMVWSHIHLFWSATIICKLAGCARGVGCGHGPVCWPQRWWGASLVHTAIKYTVLASWLRNWIRKSHSVLFRERESNRALLGVGECYRRNVCIFPKSHMWKLYLQCVTLEVGTWRGDCVMRVKPVKGISALVKGTSERPLAPSPCEESALFEPGSSHIGRCLAGVGLLSLQAYFFWVFDIRLFQK